MEIIALNPGRKSPGKRKGKKTMARRKRDSKGRFLTKGGGHKKSRKRRKYRRNPGEEAIMLANPSRGRVRKYARKAYGAARGFLGGLGLGDAARFMGGAIVGVGAAFLIRKKFGKVSDQRDNWEIRDYVMAILGGLGASILAKHAFKVRPETSNNILKGSLALVAIKILQDEIVPQSDTLKNWIGEAGEGSWSGLGYGEEMYGYSPGDLYLGEGETYVMGEDGQWRGIDEGDRVMGALAPPGSLGEEMYGEEMYGEYGDPLTTPGSLGAADPYATAYGRR